MLGERLVWFTVLAIIYTMYAYKNKYLPTKNIQNAEKSKEEKIRPRKI